MKLLIENDTNSIIAILPDFYIEIGKDIYIDETKNQKIIGGRNIETTSIVEVEEKVGDAEAVKRFCATYDGKNLIIDKEKYEEELKREIDIISNIKNGINNINYHQYKSNKKDTKESIISRLENKKKDVEKLMESIR